MTASERFRTALRRGVPDRIPLAPGFPWPDAIERWQREGLGEGATVEDVLGLDAVTGAWLPADLGFETRVLDETDEYKIEIDANGVTTKSWKDHYATPVQLAFAIKTYDDWKRHRHRLDVDRFPPTDDVIQASKDAHAAGTFHYLTVTEPIWFALRLLGHENCLEWMLMDPAFVEDIVASATDFGLAQAERHLAAGGRFSCLWLWSDLCYKNGMLYSPAIHRRLFLKHHRRIKAWCEGHDLPIVFHCDGLVRDFIPLLIEAGIDCIQPLEARCGNDVRVYKREYGNDIAFFGNIDMDVLARGDRSEIEHEVASKIEAAKVDGGYLHCSDHSVPPTVSWDTYRFWQDLAKKHAEY